MDGEVTILVLIAPKGNASCYGISDMTKWSVTGVSVGGVGGHFGLIPFFQGSQSFVRVPNSTAESGVIFILRCI